MDLPGGLPGVRAAAQAARHRLLVLAGGEEDDQLQELEGGADQPLEPRLGDPELGAHLVGLLGRRARRARTRRGREIATPRRRRRARAPRSARGTSSVALVDVGDVEHRLGGEREQPPRRLRARRRAPGRRAPGRPAPSASTTCSSQSRSAIASLSCDRACLVTRSSRRSACSRSAARSSVSISSMSPTGSTRPSGCGTPPPSWTRTTWQIASVSRIAARNWLPRPSPCDAPRTSPAMSWNWIVSGTTSLEPTVAATRSSRSSGTADDRDVRVDGRERRSRRSRRRRG